MTKPASTTKSYASSTRLKALKLAERIGVAAATRELNLYKSQIYSWRNSDLFF